MLKLVNLTQLTSSYRCKLIIRAFNKWLLKNDRVLDVGCGNGIVTKLLMDRLGIRIVGCDVKNYLIYKDIPFIKIKEDKLPFSSKKFNAVLLLDVLHHLQLNQHESLIKESLRVADKVLIFEAQPTIIGKITDVILNKYHYEDLHTPLTFRNDRQWRVLFKKMSLKYQIIALAKPFWYPFSHIAFMVERG